MNTKTVSYCNRDVYLGIDVHKQTYAVCAVMSQRKVKSVSMKASPTALVTYLHKHFEGARLHSVYEAGFSGFALHRALEGAGIDNIVVHPAALLTQAHDRVKTDRKDAFKMAAQLEAGFLHGVRIPSEQEQKLRSLTRTREQIVRERTRIGHQIKAKLMYFGKPDLFGQGALAERHLLELEAHMDAWGHRAAFEPLIALYRTCTEQLKRILTELESLLKTDDPLYQTYLSAPGIGTIGASTLAHELGNLAQRFDNQKQLFRFTGLTPSEHSSGPHVRKGHISRQGPARIRALLIQAAWRAITKDQTLRDTYIKLKARTGAGKAIVAIARKLIGHLRACFVHNTLYRCCPVKT